MAGARSRKEGEAASLWKRGMAGVQRKAERGPFPGAGGMADEGRGTFFPDGLGCKPLEAVQ